jgi:hypothetical protein
VEPGLAVLDAIVVVATMGGHIPSAMLVVVRTEGRQAAPPCADDAVFETLFGVAKQVLTADECAGGGAARAGGNEGRVVLQFDDLLAIVGLDEDVTDVRGAVLGVRSVASTLVAESHNGSGRGGCFHLPSRNDEPLVRVAVMCVVGEFVAEAFLHSDDLSFCFDRIEEAGGRREVEAITALQTDDELAGALLPAEG